MDGHLVPSLSCKVPLNLAIRVAYLDVSRTRVNKWIIPFTRPPVCVPTVPVRVLSEPYGQEIPNKILVRGGNY